MSEVFSNERLIDYFTIIDLEIIKIDNEKNYALNKSQNNDTNSINVDYNHKCILQIPKSNYLNIYDLVLENVFQVYTNILILNSACLPRVFI